MTSLAPKPLFVSLITTASTLPIFLFALPSGALPKEEQRTGNRRYKASPGDGSLFTRCLTRDSSDGKYFRGAVTYSRTLILGFPVNFCTSDVNRRSDFPCGA